MKFNGLWAGVMTFIGATLINLFMIPWMMDILEDMTPDETITIVLYVSLGLWFIFSELIAPIMIAREDAE